jgi:outer membrane immunogenic protein
MTRFFLATAAGLALLSGTALAADLPPAPMPYKAPAVVAPAYTWTGCYLDAGYGYGLWNQDHYVFNTGTGVVDTPKTTDGGRGWLGRFGVGCDYQFSVGGLGSFVVGALADYDIMSLKGTSNVDFTNTPTPLFGLAGTEKETRAWYVGPRIGYLVTPNLLTYFDGGYTATRFSQVNYINTGTAAFLGFPTGSATGAFLPAHTYNGWFLGAGTEYALNFSWLPIHGLFWRNEVRYASYRSANIATFCGGGQCGAPGPDGASVNAKKYNQTATSSLVWRFSY